MYYFYKDILRYQLLLSVYLTVVWVLMDPRASSCQVQCLHVPCVPQEVC